MTNINMTPTLRALSPQLEYLEKNMPLLTFEHISLKLAAKARLLP
jgi:hypothetical protein